MKRERERERGTAGKEGERPTFGKVVKQYTIPLNPGLTGDGSYYLSLKLVDTLIVPERSPS